MKSQNGWEASENPDSIAIKSFLIKGTGIKFRANQTAGVILSAFAAEFHALVEPIDKGALDDWGYAYRPVRDATELSNHSSGTAIDLNASKHPLGKENTYTADQQKTLDTLCAKYHLRGGYRYNGRKDDMHFEITQTPAQVQALIKQLGLKG